MVWVAVPRTGGVNKRMRRVVKRARLTVIKNKLRALTGVGGAVKVDIVKTQSCPGVPDLIL